MGVKSVKELTVYLKAYRLAMLIFEISKRFPPEERYALTGQARRSTRSVCMCLREAWAKRRYPAHFVSKLTDCARPSTSRKIVVISPRKNMRNLPAHAPRLGKCSVR